MTKVVRYGIENYYSDSKDKPEGYNSALNYINETLVNDDDYLRFRISERFNQILRDVYDANKENVREDIPQLKAFENVHINSSYFIDGKWEKRDFILTYQKKSHLQIMPLNHYFESHIKNELHQDKIVINENECPAIH